MGAFSDLFARFDHDPRVRGKQFEHVCKWFLTNDPVYKHELRRVWLWDEWTGRWGGDAGIDLVAEDRTGKLWAIQAKAYDPDYRVTKRDVNKFLAESGREVFAYRMLIATTNLIDRVGERTIQDQEKRVSFFRLNDLQAANVNWPASPTVLRAGQPHKPARPHDYQREAIKNVIKGFASADRGQLIMACGTGKTLTALFIREKLAVERTLVLVPSLSLLKQTLNVWRANCTTEFVSLPVCSDDTVARDDDVALEHTSDLGVPVTTDPSEIAAFLRRRSGPQVVFATYQSSPQIAKAFTVGRVPGFDLVVADEAHRCAGPVSSDFATVLDPMKIRAKRRLFMTATPRYFTGRVLKAADEAEFEYASMDEETKFGKVFHHLGFGEAIKRDLLTDYQVAIVGVDDTTYLEWAKNGVLVTRDGVQVTDATSLAGQIGLMKAMRKYDLRRVISFHSRVKRAREFAASMPDVLAWMPARQRPKGELWSRYASGEMPAGDRYVLLQHLGHLDEGERGLLANARCLAEGVDVPTLDGVAFVDPRRSEVDIVQAVGRAIRKSEVKTIGTVVIPVFIDSEADPEIALNDSSFKPVWDVIQALRAHDEELGEQLDDLRRSLGKRGGRVRLPGKIRLDLPRRVGQDFADSFDVRLVERTTASWEFWFGLLERYAAENGTAQVNKDYQLNGHKLGGWCVNQRARHRQGKLPTDYAERLGALPGWAWDRHDSRWDAGFQHLLQYVEQNDHALISAREVFNGYPLGSWVAIQRRDSRTGKLPKDRREQLDAVPGWAWSLEEERWEKAFRHLQEYVDSHGDSLVKQSYEAEDGFRLGAWVNFQRARYRKNTLEQNRVERLARLPGWVWEASEAKWDHGFQHLRQFAETHGHVRVPTGYEVDGFRLRDWLTNNRVKFNKLSPARQQRLKGLPGWDDYSHDIKWEKGYQYLLAYVREHGDAKVERSYVVDDYPLGTWAMTQRLEFKKKKLAPSRVKRLAALPGWDWDRRGNKWEDGYDRLVKYMKENGSPPPMSYVEDDDYRLGAWTNQQRHLGRSGELTKDRWERLNKLKGWEWYPPRGAAARRA